MSYLIKNFQDFVKFKKNGKFVEKEKFPNFRKDKKDFKKKDGKDSQSSQGIMCYECNGCGHLKKKCVRIYMFHLLRTYVMILCNWLIL